jgi:hypothetical protein
MDRNHPSRSCWRLACAALVLAWPAASPAAVSCKPLLTVTNVREVRPTGAPVQPWVWKATIVADSAHCATTQGAFEIDFIRTKEDAPDLQFTEKLRWVSGEFDVAIELSIDESIHDYRIGFVAPCICREPPYELPRAASR